MSGGLLLTHPGTAGVALAANGLRPSVNDGRCLSYRPLDEFGLPLVVTLVCQVAAADRSFDLGIRNPVREGVYRECEVNAGAVTGVDWIRAKVVDVSQNSWRLMTRSCGSASFPLLAIVIELPLNPGDESVCFRVG